MNAMVDRMWNIHDAVLLWLYERHAEGEGDFREIDPEIVAKAVGWGADAISDSEINRSTAYLHERGLISGMELGDGSLFGVNITAAGSDQAATGMSVKPGPEKEANTTGVTNNYTFNNNGPSNNAVNSSGFTQNITIEEKAEQIRAVADALDAHAESGYPNAGEARETAAGLRELAGDPESNKSKLRELLTKAAGAFALAVGTSAGQQALQHIGEVSQLLM